MKILIALLRANGDCLLATPVARQIKEIDYPNSTLTWLVNSQCRQSLENNPYIDQIVETDITKEQLSEYLEKLKPQYDIILNLDHGMENYAHAWLPCRNTFFAAYGKKRVVPPEPILCLTEKEQSRIKQFAQENGLISASVFTILFECSPASAQSNVNFDLALSVSKKIISKHPNVKIILSSGKKVPNEHGLVDGSKLSFRENAGITHFCNLLVGCSSGITWLCQSNAARPLPSIQFLSTPNTTIQYAEYYPSFDFLMNDLNLNQVVEFTNASETDMEHYISEILLSGFPAFQNKHPVFSKREDAISAIASSFSWRYWTALQSDFIIRHGSFRLFFKGLLFVIKRKIIETFTGVTHHEMR